MAVACGLSKIPSGVWSPSVPENMALNFTIRAGQHAVPPPEDALELGDRINTLWVISDHVYSACGLTSSWAVYELDLYTFLSYQWSPILQPNDIATPFPRPIQEYATVSHRRKEFVNVS
jgi:hypothetical protein